MLIHDEIAGMMYEDQKRKLDFVNKKGWQFLHLFDKKQTIAAVRQPAAMKSVPQTSCQTCCA